MSNPLPLLIAGGAVLLLASGKKRPKKKKASTKKVKVNETPSTPASFTTWEQRKEALKALSKVNLRAQDGSLTRLCLECDPVRVDVSAGEGMLAAVKAFQQLAGLEMTGEWGVEEDAAMHRILAAIEADEGIPCNPKLEYPANLECAPIGPEKFILQARPKSAPPGPPVTPDVSDPSEPSEPSDPSEPSEYTPDDMLVADADCNYILHQSEKWFDEQRNRVIAYALEDMTDADAANEINESMLADYLPLCLTLGRSGVGSGVREFWDANVGLIFTQLQAYASLPDVLEEDAYKYGIL